MVVMVDLHGFCVDVGFERIESVGQLWQGKDGGRARVCRARHAGHEGSDLFR